MDEVGNIGERLAGTKISEPLRDLYRYQLLQGEDAIRMVELLPGIPGAPIRVALHHRTLSDLPTCSAVSYEWGSNARELVIFCNDRVLKVTANLSLLLSKFRSSDSSQLLWIDAISINQEDLDERSQQVQLMGKIYKNAAVVLMWIGDQTPYTGDAIPIFRRLAELLHTFKLEPGCDELDVLPYANHQDLDSSAKEYLWNIRQSSWTGMIDLLSRDYFGRLWVIQEIVLSSKAVVVCGKHQIEWEIFYKTAMCLHCLDVEYLPKAVLPAAEGFFDRVLNISMLGQLNFHPPDRTFVSLLRMAQFFTDSKVTDPRDYVYGYLGILDSHSLKHEIHVDYSSTVEEVFRKATEKVIIEERPLEYLLDQTVEPNSRSRAAMPSWVRDWGFQQISFRPRSIPKVAERLGAKQTIFVDGNYLTAHGLIIDSTEEVSDNLREGNIKQIMLGTFINLLSGLSEMTIADVSMAARKTLDCFDGVAQTRSKPISEKSFFAFIASIHLELLADLGLGPWASSQNPKVGTWRKTKRSLRMRKSDEFDEDKNIMRLALKNILLQWSTEQSACAEELNLSICAARLNDRLFLDDRSLGVNMFKGTKGFRGYGPAGRNACVDDPPAVRIGDHIALFPTLNRPVILREGDCEGVYTLIGTAHVGNLTDIPWYEGETPSLVPIRMN
ncbi:heterokaryon incompatibility protein-domain-containing protein [Hyaloscypha finlandica]|nr:heterokaryon incompatibility protein-domain-containing protein [Hyaloscypha finlandica]